MGDSVLFIIDKLIIVFIYLNVLTANLTIGGVAIGKVLVICTLVLYGYYFLVQRVVLSKRTMMYVLTSASMIITLVAISLLKGNQIEYVMGFVTPIFILFLIPVFHSLFHEYSVERYLKHFLCAIVLLALTIIGIYVFAIGDRSLGFAINEFSENYGVAYRSMGLSWRDVWSIRIVAKTAGFFPAGIILSYYYYKEGGKSKLPLLAFGLIAFAIYLGHTFTIICAAAICLYIVSIKYVKTRYSRLLWAAVSFVIVLTGVSSYLSKTYDYKEQSIAIKAEQVQNAMDYFERSPLLGKGLGFLYRDMDQRGTEDTNLEVTYVMILTSTGLLGFLFYLFIYLYYPLKGILSRGRSGVMMMLVLSHFSVIIAGSGNPYMLSGGMGLIFVTMIGALYEVEYRPFVKGVTTREAL